MTSDKSEALLQAVEMAGAADEPIDLDSLADELSTSVETIRFELDQLQGMGLISLIAEDEPRGCSRPGVNGLRARASGATTCCISCRFTSTAFTHAKP
jgi:predicted ArsR family transcriptional regulator